MHSISGTQIVVFLAALLLSIFFTLLVRDLARRTKVVDKPDEKRKKHGLPTPLLGGVAIFISFWGVVLALLVYYPVSGVEIFTEKLFWVFVASLILLVLGVADDIKSLSARFRFVITIIAALVAVLGGIGLGKITNPFGGIIQLNIWGVSLGGAGTVYLLSALLSFLWLMGMMYTTKILDGLDGLSSGISLIGALMIFFLTNTDKYFQPNVGLLSLAFAGACLGFLIFNFHPAKIFLGEAGSLLIGFILGVLSIISGGKVATALLVMAIPIFDLVRVTYARMRRRQSIFEGDREHLHYRLLDAGLSHRQAVLAMYLVALLFGVTTLFFQSSHKLIALVFLAIVMILIAFWSANKNIKP